MKRIKAMTEIKVSVDDINHLNSLIEKDYAKPLKVKRVDDRVTYWCPSCNRCVVDEWAFCPRCGQRLDTENEQL